MKYTSALITDARNKLGGDVFARNRAGLYVRVKVKPKNPKTTIQQANRANFSTFTKGWRSLTTAQISGWNNLASQSTLTDTLGNIFKPSGLQLYISLNRNLALIGAAPYSDAPGIKPSFPTLLAGTNVVNVVSGIWNSVVLTVSAEATPNYHHLQGSMTAPLSHGISFVGGAQYRNIGAANAAFYSQIFWTPNTLWPVKVPVAGQQIGVKVRLIDTSTGYASAVETALITPTFS